GDLQRQWPHVRNLSSRDKQPHDRSGLHRDLAAQRPVVRGRVHAGPLEELRESVPDAPVRSDPRKRRRIRRPGEQVRDAGGPSHAGVDHFSYAAARAPWGPQPADWLERGRGPGKWELEGLRDRSRHPAPPQNPEPTTGYRFSTADRPGT